MPDKDIGGIQSELRVERNELNGAIYVLNEEVIPILSDDTLEFIKSYGPVYNPDNHCRNLSTDRNMFDRQEDYDKSPFCVKDVQIECPDGRRISVDTAYSYYESNLLKEPKTGKALRVDNVKYNPAYFSFNSNGKDKIETDKQIELTRIDEFHNNNHDKSAFDARIDKPSLEETLILRFDGYVYTFSKYVNSKKERYVELEITQVNPEKNEKKMLRRSGKLGNVNSKHFDSLVSIANKAVLRAVGENSNS